MAFTISVGEMIKYGPEELYSFNVYSYEYIDNLNFTLNPQDFLNNSKQYIQIAREILTNEGWNGEGDINLMWIPPFVFSGVRDGEFEKGIIIWHVKQCEDGISWILSPIEFPFEEFK